VLLNIAVLLVVPAFISNLALGVVVQIPTLPQSCKYNKLLLPLSLNTISALLTVLNDTNGVAHDPSLVICNLQEPQALPQDIRNMSCSATLSITATWNSQLTLTKSLSNSP